MPVISYFWLKKEGREPLPTVWPNDIPGPDVQVANCRARAREITAGKSYYKATVVKLKFDVIEPGAH